MAKLTPEKLTRTFIEIIFVLLGALVVWLGASGQIFFDRRRLPWLIASLALILWGLRALYRPGRRRASMEDWIRGISMTVLGAVMLVISRVPFAWVGRLLMVGGAILILRGLAGCVAVLRGR